MVYKNRWRAGVVGKVNRLEPETYQPDNHYTDDRSSEAEAITGMGEQLVRTQNLLLARKSYMGYDALYH